MGTKRSRAQVCSAAVPVSEGNSDHLRCQTCLWQPQALDSCLQSDEAELASSDVEICIKIRTFSSSRLEARYLLSLIAMKSCHLLKGLSYSIPSSFPSWSLFNHFKCVQRRFMNVIIIVFMARPPESSQNLRSGIQIVI